MRRMKMLLRSDDVAPVTVVRPNSGCPIFLTCDHADNQIPKALGDLGLDQRDRARHIAVDIGALGVARRLSDALGATLIYQNYSRLVIDSNRFLCREDSIPIASEGTDVPGNRLLSPLQRYARQQEIFRPYHDELSLLLDQRERARQKTLYIAIHSFTPVYFGTPRPWEIGILSHNDDRKIAEILLKSLQSDPTINVGDNEPYRPSEDGDFSITVHARRYGISNVAIELRQDEIADAEGQRRWAERLIAPLEDAVASIGATCIPV
jgi:predicted N-formylglutamate amidohydrolase